MENFNSNLAEQRKKVALDFAEELRKTRQQREDLVIACKDALKKLNWPIYTDKEIKTMKPCRDRLKAAIAKAEEN